jgi:D-alanyl-D-alanine carboxypeptidase
MNTLTPTGRARFAVLSGAVALGVASLAACGSDEETAQAPRVAPAFELTTKPMSEKDAAALPQPMVARPGANSLEAGASPGFLYGVWDPVRGVHLEAFGVADHESGAAMEVDDSFRIGSITKTFTATAVLLLVDDGKVRLDEPIATYAGSLTDRLPDGNAVTVREALGMTSGWPEYTNDAAGPFVSSLVEPDKRWTASELVAEAARQKATKRGEYAYVNTNYVVLGELIARASGMSYGEFIAERILGPLGLEHTKIPNPTETATVDSHGHMSEGWNEFEGKVAREIVAAVIPFKDVTDSTTSVGGSAGNGVSTLGDLAKWAAADFGNVLLSPQSRAERVKPTPTGGPGVSYGLGLEMVGDLHYHGGEIFGWESMVMANPKTGQVVVLDGNACCGQGAYNLLIALQTFPNDPDIAPLRAAGEKYFSGR